jgi:hypothetical protein
MNECALIDERCWDAEIFEVWRKAHRLRTTNGAILGENDDDECRLMKRRGGGVVSIKEMHAFAGSMCRIIAHGILRKYLWIFRSHPPWHDRGSAFHARLPIIVSLAFLTFA